MKSLLVLLTMLSVSAQAQSVCSSIWIFRGDGACATKVELVESPSYTGGAEQHGVCASIEAQVRARGGVRAANLTQPTPVSERQKGKGVVTYKYTCSVAVKTCALSDKLSSQVGGAAPAGATCLSCEGIASPSDKAACLENSIRNVIQARAVEVRDSDIAAVKAEVAKVLKLSKHISLSMDTLTLFTDFVESK